MVPALEHGGDVELRAVVRQQVETFAYSLQHPELDAVVNKLGEMPRPRRSRMHVTPLGGERAQGRFYPRDRLAFATDHETWPMARAAWTTGCANVCKPQISARQPFTASDRIPPIGIASIGDDVAWFQDGGKVSEHCIDWRAGGNVKHDQTRRPEVDA
jgi:hypothetical protein